MEEEVIKELREIKKKLTKHNELVSLILEKHDEYMYFFKEVLEKIIILGLLIIGIFLILNL